MNDIANTYKDSSELTWTYVKKWGKMYVAPKGIEKWIHEFSREARRYWIYVPELDVYRSNVSAM